MNLRYRLLIGAALFAMTAATPPARAQAPADALATVKEMKCMKESAGVIVSFRLDGALGPEDRATIESGIPVTFVHRLTIFKRRQLFFDKSLARRTVEVAASLDTLTKQYTLNRTIDGVASGSSTTDSYEVAERWLSEVNRLEIALPPDVTKQNIELRVRSEYRHIYAVYLFPWSLAALGDGGCR